MANVIFAGAILPISDLCDIRDALISLANLPSLRCGMNASGRKFLKNTYSI